MNSLICTEIVKAKLIHKKCIHNIRPSRCKLCKGSQICIHGIQRSHCKLCGGSEICKHDKQRATCGPCGGSQICKTPLCSARKNPKYKGHCLIVWCRV